MRTPQSHTALENPPSQSTLEDLRMPVQAKLAAAWTSFMFLYIYVDYSRPLQARRHRRHPGRHRLRVRHRPRPLSTMALTLMAIPILMIVLSMTLPARANRTMNLIVASLYIPVSAFNAVGESWTYFYFYGLCHRTGSDRFWPSSCGPPGPGPAPHRRRPWRPWRPARTVKPFAPSSKREPKSSPRPVRSHLPRCRGVGLLAVGHQLPLGRRVGAFQSPYRQVRSSDAHTGPPHRRHRPQARQRRRPPHRPATTGTPSRRIRSASPTITQEGPGHDRGTRAHQDHSHESWLHFTVERRRGHGR